MMKFLLIVFLGCAVFIIVFFNEAFQVLIRIGGVSVIPSRQIFKQCSWLKQIPKSWNCTDNWNKDDRFITASSGNSSLELHIYSPYIQISKTKCNFKLLVSLPHKPSASGIAIPYLCINDKDKFYYADWEQDNFEFHLKAKNVSRLLFLDNLQRVGYNPFR